MSEPIIEVSGTVMVVYPIEFDSIGNGVQKLIINNVSCNTHTIQTESKLLLVVKVADTRNPLVFTLTDPITVRGYYFKRTFDFLSVIHTVHAPIGFVRYKGKVYQ